MAGLFALATLTMSAQTATPAARNEAQRTPATANSLPGPAPIQINRRVIVLDPAHGGIDSGSQISDTTVEKDVTLALAFRLRSMLTVRGFRTMPMQPPACCCTQPEVGTECICIAPNWTLPPASRPWCRG
jgi:N-acetylmuramoyl-L-alanine amidase